MAKANSDKNREEIKTRTIVRKGIKVEDDTEWVFESLIGFLTGPVWDIPMMNFIEKKSSVFDPSEDNRDEYKTIHEEYRNLVDLLLNSFTQDLGISAEQFEKACHTANGDLVASQLQQTLFEQIWAAEDYNVFVRIMIQKNTELQLLALDILKKHGVSFDSSVDTSKKANEDAELNLALVKSMEEHKRMVRLADKENAELKHALDATLEENRRQLQLDKERERELLDKAIRMSLEQTPEDAAASLELSNEISPHPTHNDDDPLLQTAKKQHGVSPDDLAQRQLYLRQQRDKLVALKMEKRMKQLDELREDGASTQRPRSARVAQEALRLNSDSEVDPKMLAARHALAARLKAEVLGKK